MAVLSSLQYLTERVWQRLPEYQKQYTEQIEETLNRSHSQLDPSLGKMSDGVSNKCQEIIMNFINKQLTGAKNLWTQTYFCSCIVFVGILFLLIHVHYTETFYT